MTRMVWVVVAVVGARRLLSLLVQWLQPRWQVRQQERHHCLVAKEDFVDAVQVSLMKARRALAAYLATTGDQR